MKRRLVLGCSLLALAGLALWPGRRQRGVGPVQTQPPIMLPVVAVTASRDAGTLAMPGAPADADGARLIRLLDDTRARAERIARLSSDDIDQFEELSRLTNEFAAGLDAESAAYLVRNMPSGFVATSLGDQALRFWAGADRAAAAAWMAAHPDPSPVAAGALAHGWWGADRASLEAYLAALPEGEWRTRFAVAAGEDALVAGAPEAVSRLLAGAPGGDARGAELLEWAALRWAVDAPEAARGLALAESDPARRARLLATVSVGQANRDPLAAAERLLTEVNDPAVVAPALGSIVRIWAGREPAEAARWVEAFPGGPEKAQAIRQLLEIWAPADKAAAARWQQALVDPVARRQAEEALVAIEAEIEEPLVSGSEIVSKK